MRKTVLIADDNRLIRHVLRLRLQALGFDVIECIDGSTVAARCRGTPVDAMVLDQEMPRVDGVTLAHELRQHTDVPIVFMSGYPEEHFRDNGMLLPNTYYLQKPFEMERFDGLMLKLVQGAAQTTA